ncbi:chorismate-binding protein [Flavobacterium sp. xlx-214]|uniref:anthranilate synthase component I family protein n=1 Tax=unclassified Flavobacterium TaxID=196869 RepID=UPI0013D6AA3B|nr:MULTISPECIES: anthranilate synthase component I family protein [unclassified Flavobacterium]MBA5791621.1 chorismate-binding protein [Flavobacterium sp. xlx-221]QMI82866.1 chorismate-binding protein [Flavobacterium sp. xlx-214]
MQRFSKTYSVQNSSQFKKQVLQWAQQFREVVFLESNNHKAKYSTHQAILAFDAFTLLQTDYVNAFDALKEYQKNTNDWLFGYLGYDLKNDVAQIQSKNFDGLHFPDLFFFQPKKLIFFEDDAVRFEYLGVCSDEITSDFEEITAIFLFDEVVENDVIIQSQTSFTDYEKGFNNVMHHIQQGDIYEANYCINFFVENKDINPTDVFWKLNQISEPPFACFGKFNKQYVLSASPERYLKKEELKIISQPIKGTAKRGLTEIGDDFLKNELASNKKEQSENVMIVDLVRNDLSKTATKRSVLVEELFGIYSFKQVHQMISTVVSTVSDDTNVVDIIKSTFPMGSMTGAPKLSAMKIIEDVEQFKRSLYSGSIGYFTPNNDFDFNVVIRSILYNQQQKYLSFSVGSAITINANAVDEYNECLLKANAMKKVLEEC